MTSFHTFLQQRIAAGGFSTEDTLSSLLPLIREVLDAHAAGFVAPLEGLDALHVDGVRLWFAEKDRRSPLQAATRLRSIEAANRANVEILNEQYRTADVGEGTQQIIAAELGKRDQEIQRPVYLPGYVSWEHQIGHHDPLTDVFSLGMLLASLACGLDFTDPAQLETFVSKRRNLFELNASLHPVLARAIVQMTELDRHRRVQQLSALLHSLEHYRDQDVDFEFDLARIPGFRQQDSRSKQSVVLSKLRERLFEISRRNRLLHFRPTMQTANLTQASVPLSFDIKNIRPNQILIWDDAFKKTLIAGKAISLNKYLNFAEALYLPSLLDRIIAEARKDQAEYGFAQLRLVVCFLNWANLKEKPVQQFASPLVLVPVQLKKKKGVRDTYTLQALESVAEVNPVIRHQFKQLYAIDLPETLDLTKTTLDAFFDYLAQKIEASEPAITLNKIDRPRIALIHDKAKRKLDQYRRRARVSGRGVRTFMDVDYSYDPANYHPLGIKLFSSKIQPPSTSLQAILEQQPRPRSYVAPADEPTPTVEKSKTFFQMQEGGDDNPYSWDFDLCNVTLANFKYRKMSLVRDYEALLQSPCSNPAFEATFSLTPRDDKRELLESPPLDQRYDVVPCDPTQAIAIEEARAESSYIIQGPPGTGKSQTITNLIADYVARGKRVLFVCEKRAAIDVVYARLRQCGLGSLCCLIHDSQADKKAFVMDLKQTYENLLEQAPTHGERRSGRRKRLLNLIDKELQPLERFDAAMQSTPSHVGLPVRDLISRCLTMSTEPPPLDDLQKERLPGYADWWQHREAIERYVDALDEAIPDRVLAHHPLSRLSCQLIDAPRPLEQLTTHGTAAQTELQTAWAALTETLDRCGEPLERWNSLQAAGELTAYARCVLPLVEIQQLDLLDSDSDTSKQFDQAHRLWEEQQQIVRDAAKMNQAWVQKLTPADTTVALEQARVFETKTMPWLSPAWWRLRNILRHAYPFASDAVRRSWVRVLTDLQHEYQQIDAMEQFARETARRFHIDTEVSQFHGQLQDIRRQVAVLDPGLLQFHRQLLASPNAEAVLRALADIGPALQRLTSHLEPICDDYQELSLVELDSLLEQMLESRDTLPDVIRCLQELRDVPDELRRTLIYCPLTPDQVEAAIADHSLARVFQADRSLQRFSAGTRNQHVERIENYYQDWLDSNAEAICDTVKRRFLENVRISSLPAAQLKPEEKQFKKRYNRGRRELEHEFGKSMRYKSIRDLVTDESGEVVKDLKPVWLMSPLSVSDTLPLDTQQVDVVIFDEASQITLEEAIPSLFRAQQTIVVGDQMQLPPTDFFAVKRSEEDEEETTFEEDGEIIEYDLSSNSFLNHAATNLPSTMLGWHYRSRSESLISFSNWAFYDGRLLTVPEERLPEPGRRPLVARIATDAVEHVDEVFQRPISFHLMEHGRYEKRQNRAEAEYIAELVREVLNRRSGVSIGVIAFSEAQQSEIEAALQRLAKDDAAFRELLDAELERDEDNQFVGLLVKNLENIQGDERDVIILSVCYGPDARGKMLMNFGPINRSGGEKRLNVAFSRAKHHMVLVSSIRHDRITNDYNDGANCLKNYLHYAEAVSTGDRDTANRILHGMSPWHHAAGTENRQAIEGVAQQLAAALSAQGFIVDHHVGQSHFRCDLGVRRPDDTIYRLGIMMDSDAYYEQPDILERDMMRPKLLRAFGWRLTHVLAKDWHADREAVLKRLEGMLEASKKHGQ
ncbi:AAA domain-containing protein [Roseimaritima ulvae]|uniref:RecBCD enzyme subunit RecD n=1 Tax=Roseimaritima ulvae TaxID=980254 RepID=A0A5B9QX15_9BACT|nr:AAA domain-containing protein [Roseimaritima ulvae]QEG38501.1 RecBCD enzyme subunit RecD [Roseimaritima ulvae]